jgi:hypothetical protein
MTRRMSQRARAQEIYREMAAEANAATPTPTPDPSRHPPSPNGLRRASGGGEKDLTARVRALYENSAVPVREVARLAGVTERTLYKYAQKGGWKPRYAWIDRGGVQRRWRANMQSNMQSNVRSLAQSETTFAPGNFTAVKGAGGRFIARADKGKPFARGLKATDRHGAARASAACVRAETIAAQAQADAAWLTWKETFISLLKSAAVLRDQLAAYRALRAKRRPQRDAAAADPREQSLSRAGHVALDCLEVCQAHMHQAMQRVVTAQATGR